MAAQLASASRVSIAASFHMAARPCSRPIIRNCTCLFNPPPPSPKRHPTLTSRAEDGIDLRLSPAERAHLAHPGNPKFQPRIPALGPPQ